MEMELYTILENQLMDMVCWILAPPELSLERQVQFMYTTLPDTATEEDFNRKADETILLSLTSSVCVNVTVIEDRGIENQECFFVELTSGDSAIHFNSSVVQVCCDGTKFEPFTGINMHYISN